MYRTRTRDRRTNKMTKINYRSLKGYKYQLLVDYEIKVPILNRQVEQPYIYLSPDGYLLIKKGYCWDGPSGPTWDTANSMRGSLVHDALYQLLREAFLQPWFRKIADLFLRVILLEDGMSRIRAWVWYRSVRTFAAKYARVKK